MACRCSPSSPPIPRSGWAVLFSVLAVAPVVSLASLGRHRRSGPLRRRTVSVVDDAGDYGPAAGPSLAGRLAHPRHHRAPLCHRRRLGGGRPHPVVRLPARSAARWPIWATASSPTSRPCSRTARSRRALQLGPERRGGRAAARARHPGPPHQHRRAQRRRLGSPACSAGSPAILHGADSLIAVFDTALAHATVAPTPHGARKVLLLVWEQPPMTHRPGQLPERADRAGRGREPLCRRDHVIRCREHRGGCRARSRPDPHHHRRARRIRYEARVAGGARGAASAGSSG